MVPGVPEGVKIPIPKKILVLYVGKNTSDEREYLVDLDRELGSKILSRPRLIEECVDAKRLPPKHAECPNMSSKRARKCELRRLCFGKRKK